MNKLLKKDIRKLIYNYRNQEIDYEEYFISIFKESEYNPFDFHSYLDIGRKGFTLNDYLKIEELYIELLVNLIYKFNIKLYNYDENIFFNLPLEKLTSYLINKMRYYEESSTFLIIGKDTFISGFNGFYLELNFLEEPRDLIKYITSNGFYINKIKFFGPR